MNNIIPIFFFGGNTMTKSNALDILFEETPTDYILEDYETPDFFQFTVSCGGDVVTYRIYKKDGRLCIK